MLSDENCSDNDYDDEDVNDDDDDDDNDDNNTNHNHSNNFDILKESSLSHGGYSMCFESCFLPAPKYCTISFIKQLCPQTRNLNYCFIFSPEGMLSVSVLRLIKIRICRISSYRISGNNDVITAFFEGYDKAVRPGFGKI